MYQYPNGLKCAVSAMRVRAYEATIPPLAFALSITGLAVAFEKFFSRADLLSSIPITLALATTWVMLCASAAYLIFQIWCKPIAQDQPGDK